MTYKTILKVASLLAAFAVVLGAFGAHGLREKIDARSLENWDTATRYQFYHVFGLFIVALLMMKNDSKQMQFAARFFCAGILFFCGSLYFLALRALFSFNLLWLGPITPLGGLCFIIGWVFLFLSINKMNNTSKEEIG